MRRPHRPSPLALGLLAGALLLRAALAQPDPSGAWRGAIAPDLLDLEIRVVVTGEGGALAATLDIPPQGLFDFPLADVTFDGSELRFRMPGIAGDPTFAGALDGHRVEGTFTQGGQVLPFFLERRPQEPLPPFPYLEEEVTFASGDVTLAGSLTLPAGDARVPALLLIAGSGAQDRNDEIVGHKPFLVIADHLTRAGYAVLRVDDRGVDGSTGSDATASFDDLLGDVLEGVALLRRHPRVAADRIGLLGQREGGYLAAAAADATDVAFVILMAGPGVDGFATMVGLERVIRADPAAPDGLVAEIADLVAFLEALYRLLLAEDDDEARVLVRQRIEDELAARPEWMRPDAATAEQFIAAQQAYYTGPSFRRFFTFDPQPYLRRLTVPTLALFGELDQEVIPDQSVGPMREAFEAAGNADATVLVFPGLNHRMQPAITGRLEEYGAIATTIDPVVLEAITDWLLARFPVR